ncbi:MAG: hypothetical protein OK422_05040 [Thaumarchaeota archaeon]|nr:hypothetical protein [Nitrososphaerota archaeon]
MLSNEEMVSSLQKLGLNLYESKAYLALLTKKQASAKDVGQIARIPQSRTYDVLESLTKKGYALTIPTSPKAYAPVPPQTVLHSSYEARKEEAQSMVIKVQQSAERRLSDIQEAYTSLMQELPGMTSQDLNVPESIWVVEGQEQIENAMISLIQQAKLEHVRITRPLDFANKPFFDPFYIIGMENMKIVDDALKRHVKMRWLSLAREIPSIIGLEVGDEPERRYLERDEDIPEKFVMVDGHSVLLNLREPLSQAFGSQALLMHSKVVTSIFREHFEAMWERAKPLADILPPILEQAEEASSKLREIGFKKTEVALYTTLLKTGANTLNVLLEEVKGKRIVAQEAQEAIERLTRAGLVHRISTFRLIAGQNPIEVLASIKKGKLGSQKR